jgi:phosphopantothenoylcysteine decarboxylase/phosphopantothenate--cysteine ligase
VLKLLATQQDLTGIPVMVTAGPTREYFDPVRYVSNPSTGKMGFALAAEAAARGADVILITGPASLPDPPSVRVLRVTTADEMLAAVLANFTGRGLFVGAAAVSDYRPATKSDHKLKKSAASLAVQLVRTPDVIAAVAKCRGDAVLVGFAAESDELLTHARDKLAAKRLDLVVANDITQPGAGFAVDTNQATLLWADGRTEQRSLESKRSLAAYVIDSVRPLLGERCSDGARDTTSR